MPEMSKVHRQKNPHLVRCQLCDHGPDCSMLKKGTCGFAHSLAEVLPPNEKTTTYCGVWRDGVDRFYAQQMSERQIARVDRYWRKFSATFERPVWCYGMLWWFQDRPLREHPELGWDFGIWQDVDTMTRARKPEVVPF